VNAKRNPSVQYEVVIGVSVAVAATTAIHASPHHTSPQQTPKSRYGPSIRAALEFCPCRESDDRGQTLRDAVDPTEAPFPHETQQIRSTLAASSSTIRATRSQGHQGCRRPAWSPPYVPRRGPGSAGPRR
jgi:hypothetical protein